VLWWSSVAGVITAGRLSLSSVVSPLRTPMKNANVFVDVDLTLVDANGRLLDGAREGLQRLKDEGCHLFLWSTVGLEYARSVATQHQITDLFEGFAAKPDIIIDDMPSTAVAPFIFNVHDEGSWPRMAERIIEKHID
jgi:hypothetical protein